MLGKIVGGEIPCDDSFPAMVGTTGRKGQRVRANPRQKCIPRRYTVVRVELRQSTGQDRGHLKTWPDHGDPARTCGQRQQPVILQKPCAASPCLADKNAMLPAVIGLFIERGLVTQRDSAIHPAQDIQSSRQDGACGNFAGLNR